MQIEIAKIWKSFKVMNNCSNNVYFVLFLQYISLLPASSDLLKDLVFYIRCKIANSENALRDLLK